VILRPLSKVAVTLNVDRMANSVMERFYSNNRRARARFARRFQILCYHKVSPDLHPYFAPVAPAVFEQQMRFLKSCYRVLSLRELVERSQRGDVPSRSVAITFDDGYSDNYENAFPILKRYGLPATIFVATGAIGTGNPLWHDQVFDAFRFATVTHARLNDSTLPALSLESPGSRDFSVRLVLDRARTLYGGSRRKFIDDLEQKLRPSLPADRNKRMLNWEQIRKMHQEGIEIGSHTVSHPILSRITREEMTRELADSRRKLCDELGGPVFSFAYPNGRSSDYNETVKALVKESGYSCAVTCQFGFNEVFSDPFDLKRGQPWQSEIDVFRFKFFLQRHGLAS
jgi:peptidoglycan/xylan/chitin deacetylase (PgdA/CDA1 family)